MAVEKTRVSARIKALFPKTNLSQKRMDALSDRLSQIPADDADDASIDQAINDFNEVVSFEDLARVDDKARADAAKAKKGADDKKKEKKAEAKTDDDDEDDNEPAYVKRLFKTIEDLKSEVQEVKAGKATETKFTQAKEVFEKSSLKNLKPELQNKWLNRINLDSETSFEDQVKDLEDEYTELVQAKADSTILGGPAGGGKPVVVNQKEVDEIVSNMNI